MMRIRNSIDRRAAVAIVLLCACGAVLGAHALEGLRATRDLTDGRWHAEATDGERRLGCLEQQVDAAVPPGSRVSIDPALGNELWQRTLEIAWKRAVLVRPGGPADLSLTAAPGAPADACAGPVVVAEPGPLPAATPLTPGGPGPESGS